MKGKFNVSRFRNQVFFEVIIFICRIQMFSGFKKKSDNVDDLISEEIGTGKPPVSSFKSPDMVQKKAKIGSKPNFMMKKSSNVNVTGDLE